MADEDKRAGLEGIFLDRGERDAITIVRDATKQVLPKRFYTTVVVEERPEAFAILLDGKPVRTPRAKPLALPTRKAAELVAGEWAAQGEHIDPSSMPATRLVNAALDGVADNIAATAADIARYVGSDLLCYRAAEPPALVAAQSRAWDPVLAFIHEQFGARMAVAEGVVFVTQPPEAVVALTRAIDGIATGEHAALRIAALHLITTLTGSALLALAFHAGHLDAEAAWSAAQVDEDEQMRVWGFDAEALRRRAARWEDMKAACALLAALG